MLNIILSIIIILLLLLIYFRFNIIIIKGIKNKSIISLLRQFFRWYIASIQDLHPLVKILHANYAVGYYSSLLDIATIKEIISISGLTEYEFNQLGIQAKAQQDLALKIMIKNCPNIIPKNKIYQTYLKNIEKIKLN